jgi:hypothetical protein
MEDLSISEAFVIESILRCKDPSMDSWQHGAKKVPICGSFGGRIAKELDESAVSFFIVECSGTESYGKAVEDAAEPRICQCRGDPNQVALNSSAGGAPKALFGSGDSEAVEALSIREALVVESNRSCKDPSVDTWQHGAKELSIGRKFGIGIATVLDESAVSLFIVKCSGTESNGTVEEDAT